MVQTAFVRGRISVGSYQPRDRNTKTNTTDRTDLPLRPKATGNETTTYTRNTSREVSPSSRSFALSPLVSPLGPTRLKVVLVLLPTRYVTVALPRTRKVPSIRHVMNSIKNLKVQGSSYTAEIYAPANVHAIFNTFYKFVKLSTNNHIVGLIDKHYIVNATWNKHAQRMCLMYHAPFEDEFQPFTRSYSQLTLLFLKKSDCETLLTSCMSLYEDLT